MTRPAPRIFLVGLYGIDNLGDDAIRIAVERAAAQLGAEVHRYAVRRSVADPRAVRLRGAGWRGYVQAIRTADRVAIGGGGLLKDEGHAALRGYGLLLELLLTALLARALRTQVALLAIGAGPLHTRRGRWLVAAIARLAQIRQVRDEDSAATLRALGVARVEVTVDPTFSRLEETASTTPTADRHALLSMRPWFVFEPERERREATLQAAFARAAETLAQAGAEPRFANLYWPRDRDAAAAAIARMQAPATARSLDGPLSWEQLAQELRGARLLVAMRYHAIACAAMAGCPIVPVAYEPKVVALAQALRLPYLDVADPELERRLPQLVAAALADPDAHRPAPARLRELGDGAWDGLRRVLLG